jgi:hypothetical protein
MNFFNEEKYIQVKFNTTRKTSREIVLACETLSRQNGKTTLLIDSLIPGEDTHVIVHSWSFGREFIKLVRERRPNLNFNRIKIVQWNGEKLSDLLEQFKGTRNQKVLIDNAVIDLITQQSINKIYNVLREYKVITKTETKEVEI